MIHTIGIDPGPICGVVALDDSGAPPLVAQIDGHHIGWLIDQLAGSPTAAVLAELGTALGIGHYNHANPLICCEHFVSGPRAGRLGDVAAADLTRGIEAMLQMRYAEWPRSFVPNATAKTWASNKRLDAAGLLKATDKMADHARSAARHALYGAVKTGRMRDPLLPRHQGD